MDTAGPRPSSGRSPSTKWSLIAGVYLLAWAALLLVATNQVTGLVAELLALPTASAPWLAAPVPVVGGVWWATVERRDRYTYALGGAVGLATALCTVVFWLLRGAPCGGWRGSWRAGR